MKGVEVKSELKMKGRTSCHCCPYGFHIDRDFVRYCDTLYNNGQVDKLKQKKRERRKEQRTVESYLGLNNTSGLNSYASNLPGSNHHASLSSEEDIKDSPACDLDSAVSDFENTLQKSINEKPLFSIAHSMKNECSQSIPSEFTKKPFNIFCQSEDKCILKQDSSVTSCTTVSLTRNDDRDANASTLINLRNDAHSHMLPDTSKTLNGFVCSNKFTASASEQMAATMETLSNVNISQATVGIHRTVLANIREQMATSLKRMKELEEEVKSIPLLQVKLSALKEERNTLLKKLNSTCEVMPKLVDFPNPGAMQQVKRLQAEGILSPRLTDHFANYHASINSPNLSSPLIASNLNAAVVKRAFVDNEIIPQLNLEDVQSDISGDNHKQSYTKSIGTSCCVLTRDVGVGHVPNRYKSTGVGEENIKVLLCPSCAAEALGQSVSSESLGSESDSADEAKTKLESKNAFSNFNSNKVELLKKKPNSQLSVNLLSGLKVSDLLPIPQNNNNILPEVNYDKQKNYCHVATCTDIHFFDVLSRKDVKRNLRNKSTSCDLPSLVSKGIQCLAANLGTRNATTMCDIQYCNAAIQATVSKTDIHKSISHRSLGVGDYDITLDMCYKCSCKTLRDVASNTTLPSCTSYVSGKSHSVGCEALLIKSVCHKCDNKNVRTVGIGDNDVNKLPCAYCLSANIVDVNDKAVLSCSVATNTDSDLNSFGNSKSEIHICDKCSATIHTLAHSFATKGSELKETKESVSVLKLSKSLFQKSSATQVKSCVAEETSSTACSSSIKKETIVSVTKLKDVNSSSTSYQEQAHNINNTNTEENVTEDLMMKEVLPLQTANPFKILPHQRVELSKEVKAACKVFNDYLQKPERGSEKKILTSINIIKQEWFHVANQKNADPHVIEDYLDAFEEFSKLLLHRVVNLSDSNGNTAIHYAVSYSNFDVVSILVDSKVCDVNKQNKAGYTCIMLVALSELKNDAHNYVVHRLFSMGDINIKAIQNGQTALMLAVSHGKLDVVKMLLDAGAEVNLQDNDGSTALMCAAEHGHIDIVRALLSHSDCDPTVVDSDGSNALAIAMEAGHKDIGLLIYASNVNFSRGSSPYSSLKQRRRSTPRSTPPSRTPTLRTPPPPSPSARSTSSLPAAFHFMN